MKTPFRPISIAPLLVLMLACGDRKEDTDAPPQDTAPLDTTPQDTASHDTASQDTAPQDTAPDLPDNDGDSWTTARDYDDANAAIHPGAAERCDGTDEDCDGLVDEGPWYTDTDGDGYGDPDLPVPTCDESTVLDGEDCDDANPDIHPGATEVCGNGVVEDCGGGSGICGTFGEVEASDYATSVQGSVLLGGSDLDGDGWDDVASADPHNRVYLYHGPMTAYTESETTLPEEWGNSAGMDAGDMTGDGATDLLVSVAWEDTPGAAYLFGGPILPVEEGGTLDASEATLLAGVSSDRLTGGIAVGDYNGDGVDDVVLASSEGSPIEESYLVLGPIEGDMDLEDSDFLFREVGGFGQSLDGGVDLDGDGTEDLAIAGATEVYVYYGPYDSTTWKTTEDVAGVESTYRCNYVESVSLPGDLDGDEIPDLLIGASKTDGHAGSVRHYYGIVMGGPIDGYTTDYVTTFGGKSWSGPGDVTGDGVPDVLAGDLGDTGYYGTDAHMAKATLYQGPFSGPPVSFATLEAWSTSIDLRAGVAGDWDGDGDAEIALGDNSSWFLYWGGAGM